MTKKIKTDWRIVCFGIAVIGALMAYALSLGRNGLLLTSVIAIIAAAVGVNIKNPLNTK